MKQETHSEALQRLGLKAGDMARVLRKVESKSNGWAGTWVSKMDIYVGKSLIVGDSPFGYWGVQLLTGGDDEQYFSFPAFVLEKVEAVPVEPERTDTVIEVTSCEGCPCAYSKDGAFYCLHPKAFKDWFYSEQERFNNCLLPNGDITIRIKKQI